MAGYDTIEKVLIQPEDNPCDRCLGSVYPGHRWVHDPSLDGHGGLNGGGWTWRRCGKCNSDSHIYPTDVAGNILGSLW